MAGGASGGPDDEISGINVTPLVDIMLVLVIILMVTAEFTKYRTVPISLPKVNASAMKREPHKVALTIKPATGTKIEEQKYVYFWNDRPITEMNTLPARLEAAKKAHPDVAVILRAEGETRYQKLLDLLDEVKKSGISKVGLAVDAEKKRGQ